MSVLNTFFGLKKNEKQEQTTMGTDPETIRAVVGELEDIMINNDEPTGYMKLDDEL